MFIHFGMNTFTDREWGDGTEDPRYFNPSELDAEQWVRLAKNIGCGIVVLTVKHHDGFCLWPSAYTTHTVANSPFLHGQGDVVKEFTDACWRNHMKCGLYVSPWDRHEPSYGTDAYNRFFVNQLTELLTQYGPIHEIWFDGANGDSDGKLQLYDWSGFFSTVRHFQPQALIAITGPDIRWAGNENGIGSETEWTPQPQKYAGYSAASNGLAWYPSECDVSIRPGWFYHSFDDSRLKSAQELTGIYLQSIGRNSNLLLNVPPNRDGRISDVDVATLRAWHGVMRSTFSVNLFQGQRAEASSTRVGSESWSAASCIDGNRSTFWTADSNARQASITVTMSEPARCNVIKLEEAIAYGQRISSFELEYESGGDMVKFFEGTTVGRSRIITFPAITAQKIRLVIKHALASPTLREFQAFYSDRL